MSFMRTLATVAVGFAAAKGVEQYKKMGGMAGMQAWLDNAGAGGMGGMQMGNITQQMTDMASKMGVAGMGGANPLADMMKQFAGASSQAAEAGAAGLGGLMSALQGAASTAGKSADDMTAAMFAGTPVSVAMEENAKLMLRAMIMAAKADGEIDNDEREKILGQLHDASAEERAFVEAELAAPLDPTRLATDAGDVVKAQIYATSLSVMKVDTASEQLYLNQLAHTLQLSNDMRARVHQSMGVPLQA